MTQREKGSALPERMQEYFKIKKNDEQNHQFNLLQTFQHFHRSLKPTIIKNILKGTTRVLHSIQSECNLL